MSEPTYNLSINLVCVCGEEEKPTLMYFEFNPPRMLPFTMRGISCPCGSGKTFTIEVEDTEEKPEPPITKIPPLFKPRIVR